MIPGASRRGQLLQQGVQPHHDCITSRAIAVAHSGYAGPLNDVVLDPDGRYITIERDDPRDLLRQLCRYPLGINWQNLDPVRGEAGNDVRRNNRIRLETRGPSLHAEAASRRHSLEVTGRDEAFGGPMKTHKQDRGGTQA